jgi:hypothetical protein
MGCKYKHLNKGDDVMNTPSNDEAEEEDNSPKIPRRFVSRGNAKYG